MNSKQEPHSPRPDPYISPEFNHSQLVSHDCAAGRSTSRMVYVAGWSTQPHGLRSRMVYAAGWATHGLRSRMVYAAGWSTQRDEDDLHR